MTRPAYLRPASLAVLSLLATALACGSNQNFDQREAYAESIGQVKDPTCIGTCLPDPGSRPVDCAAEEEGYEFLTVWDFETSQPSMVGLGEDFYANSMYSYTDNTSTYFEPRGWQPAPIEWDFCPGGDEARPNHVIRFVGGPFLAWGGGFGGNLANLLNNTSDNCDDPEVRAEHCPPFDSEFLDDTIDVSQWEGISFWARKGPDGQAGLRTMLGDKYTSDDLSQLQYIRNPEAPRYCERVQQCTCDAKDRTCVEFDRNRLDDRCSGKFGYYSGLPDRIKLCVLADEASGGEDALDCDYPYQRCQESACTWEVVSNPDAGFDPQFEGRACTEFSFRGSITNGYCFNPGEDPDPAEANQRCGDHWMSPVHLTTDWQFYKVPFDTLLQQGWAKESDFLDLTSASVIRFTFDRGWLDVYLDNVRFYRKARATSSDG